MGVTRAETAEERIKRRQEQAAALKVQQGVKPVRDLEELIALWPGSEADEDPLAFILRERAERRRHVQARSDAGEEAA